MSRIAPPPLPVVAHGDGDSVARARFHARQVLYAAVTVAFTVWCWKQSPILGAILTFVTKHVLVAIITAGLYYPHPDESSGK
ncbi:MAG: hypothetical protein U0744_06835 [Gemmataceae bacterium]